MLKKRDMIISGVNQRVKIKNNKYGIAIPQTMEEAYAIDKANNDTVSKDAINKEMNQMSVSFDILEENQRPSPNHKHVRLHLILSITSS